MFMVDVWLEMKREESTVATGDVQVTVAVTSDRKFILCLTLKAKFDV